MGGWDPEGQKTYSAQQARSSKSQGTVPVRACLTWAKRLSCLAALILGICLALEQAWPSSPASTASSRRAAAEGAPCGAHQHGSHGGHSLQNTLSFLLFSCLICAALDHWNSLVPEDWRLPISVVVFMSGMCLGVVFLRVIASSENIFIAGMQGASYLDPHAIFYVLLPPLLFESASSMSWHVLYRVLPSAVILAGPGVVINTFLVGAWAKWGLHVDGSELTWEAALLLASILSATDPVAVVAALHSLGAPKKLATLIEGESLLNDGSAVVFFGVFLDMTATSAPDATKQCPGVPPAGGCVSLYFLRLALGGPLLGLCLGLLLNLWIGWARARESPALEISITLTAIYGGFFLAESLHVSGVLAVVSLGIIATAEVLVRMSHEGRHALHLVLAQVSYTCNHVIFFSAGIISARFMWNASGCGAAIYMSPRAWGELLILYCILHVARALVIALFSPVLSRLGYGITWKEGAVLVWGGLRGAVGLAMGLLVEHNVFVDERIAALVAFHVSGIVLLTLVVNGVTVDNLYRGLQPYPPNPYHMTYLRKSLCILEEECGKAVLERMLDDWFFQDIDFDSILGCVPNFSRIEFNAARVPYPAGIRSVKDTLNSLEMGATRFKTDLLRKQKETWMKAFSERRDSWDDMKDNNCSHFLSTLWEAATSGTGKDHLSNIQNTGDPRMEYKASENSGGRGLYVSSRSLSQLADCTMEDHGFSTKVLSLEGVHALVGLVAIDEEGGAVGASPSDGDLFLGSAPNSVGFDLLTGRLRYRGACGEGDVEREDDFEGVEVGTMVRVTVTHEVGQEWQVKFEVDGSAYGLLGSCSLGPFPPDVLYPAIQFLPRTESPPSRPKSRSNTIGDLSTIGESKSDKERRVQSAALQLSYEPQTASDEESLRQLFHVLFNMVTHHYHEMHDHGLIGNEAFDWLLTSVEQAVDNAEGEVNRARAKDFRRLEKFCSGPSSKNCLEELSKLGKSAASARTFLHVFEPLIVEYLDVEEQCMKQSVFDRLSRSWVLFRRYDYHRMLVKVEALWGFVEAHEMVLQKYKAMERYPDLVKCLQLIVLEAKRDLAIVEDTKPRRYWYCKHFLALKVLMTKKRETLAKFAQEGWLGRDDCEPLNKALRDRSAQVEHFVPRLYRGQARATVGGRGGRVQSVCIPSPGGPSGLAASAVSFASPRQAADADSVVPLTPTALQSPSDAAGNAQPQLMKRELSQREQLESALGLSSSRMTRGAGEHLPGYIPHCEAMLHSQPRNVLTPEDCSVRRPLTCAPTPDGKRWDADSRIAALQGGTRGRGSSTGEALLLRSASEASGPRRPRPEQLVTP